MNNPNKRGGRAGVPLNRLTGPQQFALNSWVKNHHQKIDGMDANVAAEYVTKALHFSVTIANLISARRFSGTTFKLRHRQPSRTAAPAPAPVYRNDYVEELAAVEASLAAVGTALLGLYNQLGSPVPPELAKAMKGRLQQ